jgi:peptidoglycan-associated lipoprotein
MRVWLCLLAIGLLAGCHHQPPTIDADKTVIHPIIPDDNISDNNNDNKNGGSQLQQGTLNQNLSQLHPVFFDYDKSDIRSDQIQILQTDAQVLRQISNKVQIQGHCDERGTEEYNLALGDRRARMVREYLTSLGIDAGKLDTISYGESRPFATEHNEDAWSENRRAHFAEEQ